MDPMNAIFANTIYTGKSVVTDRYLTFNGKNITGLAKSAYPLFMALSTPFLIRSN